MKNIFGHKIKLMLSIILISFALSFFGFSVMQSNLRSHSEIEKAIKEFDMKYINIEKLTTKDGTICPLKGYWLNCYNTGSFTEDEYKKLSEEKGIKLSKKYYFQSNNAFISRSIENENEKLGYYYLYYRYRNTFSELKREDFNFNLIGDIPQNYNEVVIIKPLADFIIEYGVDLYSENDEKTLYKPSSYQELVSSKKELQYGEGKIIVSGIIDDDLSEYEHLKNVYEENIRLKKVSVKELKLINKYIYKYPVHFYVLEGFKDNFDLKQNDTRYFHINSNDELSQLKLFKSMNVYTEDGLVEMVSLEKNGIIVNDRYLDKISDGMFSKNMNEYIINGKELNLNKSSAELRSEFITNYIKENKITDKILAISLVKVFDMDEKANNTELLNIRIVGVVLDDDNYYTNKNILENNSDEKYKLLLYVKTTDIDNFGDFFNDYPIDGVKYISTNDFIHLISNHEFIMKISEKYIFIISIVISFFAILVLFNFLGISITDNKKEIGVLRALGTTKKDVSKIYSIQGLVIGLISYIVSILLVILYAKGENDLLLGDTLKDVFEVNLFGLTFNTLLIMLIFFVIVVLLSSVSVSTKVSKMKPIDAINSR